MKIHRVLCAAGLMTAATWALGGCYTGSVYEDSSSRTLVPPTNSRTQTIVGQGEALVGSMGEYSNFNTGDSEMRITTSRSGATSASQVLSSVRLDAEDTRVNRWVMTQLTVYGGLLNPMFTPGMTATFNTQSNTGVGVQVLGCSGPQRGNYTFDHSATQVTVHVEAGPRDNSRRMTFDANFQGPTGPQVVHGSFVYDTE